MAKPEGKNILVIRYRFIGDTILTVPFLRDLRVAYPQAKIDVLTGPRSGEVLEGCPYVDELICFDTTRFHKYDSGVGKPRTFFSYVKELRARRYDLVFVLKRSFSAALLAYLTGAKRRVGYSKKGRNWLLTDSVLWRQDIHEVDSLLSVLRAVNIDVQPTAAGTQVDCWVTASELAAVKKIEPSLERPGPKVLIHAAAAHPDKLYPLEHWAALVKRLAELGFTPVFSGDKQDVPLYEQLAQLTEVPALNFAGKLTLRQSMALYSLMDLAVCVDSGPSHLAAAAGVPTIALFGPTDPVRWGPYGERNRAVFDGALTCRPCNYKKVCDNRPCLTELSPDLIFDRCLEVLKYIQDKKERDVSGT